jgi:uncharacterized protein (TIGR03437 family)
MVVSRVKSLVLVFLGVLPAVGQTPPRSRSGFQLGSIYVGHSAARSAPRTPETGLAPGSLCDIDITGLYQPFGSLLPDDTVTLRFRAPGAVNARDLTILTHPSVGPPDQFTALVPRDTPTGQAEILAVTASGKRFSTSVWIAASNFGLFTKSGAGFDAALAQVWREGPRAPGLTTPVRAGEWVTLWGTGLGSAAASTIAVKVAHIRITPAYAGPAPGQPGVDQINFQFPAGVPDDCYVPVAVEVGGRALNTPSIAAASAPGPCRHRLGLSADALATLDQEAPWR